MMYGDYGHGGFFFFVGLVLIFLAPKYEGNVAYEGIFAMRYMLAMMGFFSMYNGLLYNEFFAIPNDWFGSCYDIYVTKDTTPVGSYGTYPQKEPGVQCVYPFGFDPAWWLSTVQL